MWSLDAGAVPGSRCYRTWVLVTLQGGFARALWQCRRRSLMETFTPCQKKQACGCCLTCFFLLYLMESSMFDVNHLFFRWTCSMQFLRGWMSGWLNSLSKNISLALWNQKPRCGSCNTSVGCLSSFVPLLQPKGPKMDVPVSWCFWKLGHPKTCQNMPKHAKTIGFPQMENDPDGPDGPDGPDATRLLLDPNSQVMRFNLWMNGHPAWWCEACQCHLEIGRSARCEGLIGGLLEGGSTVFLYTDTQTL